MAAILCESISKILRGSCEALGTVLTLPCRACGFATDHLTELCRSPFFLFVATAVALNLPPIVFTGKAWAGGDGGCTAATSWLIVNALLCLVNIAAAAYISAKIAYEPESENGTPFVDMEANTDGDVKAPAKGEKTIAEKILEDALVTDTRSKSMSRVRDVLCYDPVVAVYIIVGIFYVCWQTVGISRRIDASECGGGLDDYLSNSLICGFLFMTIGGCAFGISLCCMGR